MSFGIKAQRFCGPIATVLIGVTISIVGFFLSLHWDMQVIRTEFEHEAETHFETIRREIESSLYILSSIKAFYDSTEKVGRSAFSDLTRPLLALQPYVQAFEWIPRIEHSERRACEEDARRDGFSDFQITEQDTHGKIVRAGDREEYFPVYFVEPYTGNEIALGFDPIANSNRREALQKAEDTGEPAATARIKLVQEKGDQFGFLVFAPIYRKGLPADSITSRRANLKGFAVGVFRVGDLIEKSLTYLKPGGIDIYLYDRSAVREESFLYVHAPQTGNSSKVGGEVRSDDHLESSKTFRFANREWLVLQKPTRGFIESRQTWRPWGVLTIGLLLTGALAVYFIMQKRAKDSTEEQLNFLQTLINTIPSPIFYKDTDGVYLGCNSAFETYIGRSKAEVIGRTVYDIAPGELADIYRQADIALFNAPGVQQYDASVEYADGSLHDVLFTKAVFSDFSGKIAGMVGVMLDITERKQAERILGNSEARLRQIIDLVPHMIFVKDWDGKFLLANKTVAKAYSTTVDALIERNHADFHSKENELQQMLQDDREVMSSGKTMFIPEETYTDAQGNLRFLQTTKVPFHTNGGNIRAVLGVAIDITERKRVESDLKESKQRLSQIFDFLPDATFAIDRGGKVIAWNRAIEEMTGLKAEDILGKGDYEYALPFYGARRPLLIDLASQPDEAIWKNYPLIKKEGDILLTEANVTMMGREISILLGKARPLYDSRGNIVGAIESIRDITALKKTQEMLQDSEELYRSVVENIQDVFYRTDKDGQITMISPSASRLYGGSCGEILGRQVKSFWMYPDERVELIQQLERHGVVRDYELTFRRKDGSPVSVSATSTLRRDGNGNVVGVEGIIRDITERKRAEEERMRLVRAIEQVAEGIIITDANWNIQYANPAFERITGYGRDEIVGRHTRILKSDNHDETFYRQLRETLSRGEAWSGHIVNKKKDGSSYDAEVTASAIRDCSGDIRNYVSIHRDITRELQLEKELRQAQKMESIGTLAGGIAHDFNNILTPIIAYTELVQAKVPEESGLRRNLDQVLKAGFRAKELVRQILTFSRRSEQDKKTVRITPIIKEALKLLRSSLPTTIKISRKMTISPGRDAVLADPTQIHQVLMNLCTNAAHAMRVKGGILSVELSEACNLTPGSGSGHSDLEEVPCLCLTVSDTGHGMDAAVIERIFDPYFTTKTTGEGTGLGLSVAQGIIKSHGGKITVSSEPGKGTTFYVFLPGFEEIASPEVPTVETVPTGSERILFVDDEEVLVDLGKEILESLGYAVTAKTSSLDALQAFRNEPDSFDLVITDMTMPELTGRDLAKEIMAIRTNIPIILCTGFSDQINPKQAKEAGIRELVIKPYTVASLAKTIRRVLERG